MRSPLRSGYRTVREPVLAILDAIEYLVAKDEVAPAYPYLGLLTGAEPTHGVLATPYRQRRSIPQAYGSRALPSAQARLSRAGSSHALTTHRRDRRAASHRESAALRHR